MWSILRRPIFVSTSGLTRKKSRCEASSSVISHGFGDYRTIRDFPIRGRSTYLHVRKRKWLDKETGEIFSYDWELSEYDETHLNAEFVSFLKGGD